MVSPSLFSISNHGIDGRANNSTPMQCMWVYKDVPDGERACPDGVGHYILDCQRLPAMRRKRYAGLIPSQPIFSPNASASPRRFFLPSLARPGMAVTAGKNGYPARSLAPQHRGRRPCRRRASMLRPATKKGAIFPFIPFWTPVAAMNSGCANPPVRIGRHAAPLGVVDWC